jgi:hypothetical protein
MVAGLGVRVFTVGCGGQVQVTKMPPDDMGSTPILDPIGQVYSECAMEIIETESLQVDGVSSGAVKIWIDLSDSHEETKTKNRPMKPIKIHAAM